MTIAEARQIVGKSLGLPAFDVPADLNKNDRERLYDGLAEYIVRQWAPFTASQRDWAQKRIDSPFFRQSIEDYGAGDAVGDFAGEFGKQAKEIVTLQHAGIRNLLFVAALGAGLYFAFKADVIKKSLRAKA